MKRTTLLHALDPALDPAVRAILEMVVTENLSWSAFTPGVRRWLYHPPIERSPAISVIRENLNLHGRDLAVVPLEDD